MRDDKKVEIYNNFCDLQRDGVVTNRNRPRQEKLNYINNCIGSNIYFNADKFIPLREEIKQQEREDKLKRILNE